MKLNTDDHHKLEQLINKVCAEQPLRAAPATLQARVMRELQQRMTLPWWRQSFMHWPRSMQAVFVITAVAASQATLMLAAWLSTYFNSAAATTFTQRTSWLQSVTKLWSVCGELVAQAYHHIPLLWLYGVALCVVALYTVLIGLSAAVYGSLYSNR